MKASEAPKKLWWSKGAVWHTNPNSKRYIEYTRTDAFIEKACEFIETYPHLFMGVLRSEVINDFKNYMKGE